MSFADTVVFDTENLKRIEQGTTDLEAKFLIGKLWKENDELREDNRKIKNDLDELTLLYDQLKEAIAALKGIFVNL